MSTQEEKIDNFDESAAYASVSRAIRIGAIIVAVTLPVCWWKIGWPGAVAEAVGAAISLSGLREWRSLMQAVLERMAHQDLKLGPEAPPPRAVRPVVAGFLLRLLLAGALLYVSLKYLPGSGIGTAVALILGLSAGMVALLIEALRLLKTWTE